MPLKPSLLRLAAALALCGCANTSPAKRPARRPRPPSPSKVTPHPTSVDAGAGRASVTSTLLAPGHIQSTARADRSQAAREARRTGVSLRFRVRRASERWGPLPRAEAAIDCQLEDAAIATLSPPADEGSDPETRELERERRPELDLELPEPNRHPRPKPRARPKGVLIHAGSKR